MNSANVIGTNRLPTRVADASAWQSSASVVLVLAIANLVTGAHPASGGYEAQFQVFAEQDAASPPTP